MLRGYDFYLDKIIDNIKKNNKSNYDCIIPVSGGKDSFYQIHLMCKEYNLKPLLVTYHGNNYLPEGDYNRDLSTRDIIFSAKTMDCRTSR